MCFLPSSLFSPSVALMPFLTTGLISAQWPCLLIVRRRVLCLSNTAEFVFLSKTFSAPLNHSSSYWGSRSISKSFVPNQNLLSATLSPLWLKFCTTNLLLLFNNSQTSSEFQILIYRSLAINGTGQVSEHKNACFNALPPLRLTFQRHSPVFWYSMPWLQVLSNTKSVILGSQSTIKSIIVPSTNMGYLCSLKTLNFCTFSDIHQSTNIIQNFNNHTFNGLQACLHCR